MRITTRFRALTVGVALAAGTLTLTACTAADSATDAVASQDASVTTASAVWSDDQVHRFSVTVDEQDLATMLETYASTGEKEWISATVVIDGQTFENVGIKLKGNSSLRSVGTDSDPSTLPWLIRLDKFVDGQSLDGATEFVVRGNNSETSLNEAVALALLEQAGLASEEYAYAEFSVNGSASDLRLIVENPDDSFMERELGDGYLYKSEAEGDWSYRGTDPEEYATSFDQEAGEDNMTPLIEFLDFVNNSDDATFASELADYLDVDAFATYLAFQELVGNSDDIDGPGNNSYLYYDTETGVMTVVNWDLNLSFGGMGGFGGAGRDGQDMPDAGDQGGPGDRGGRQPGGEGDDFSQRGGGMGGRGGNVLSERFLENAEFTALYEAKLTALEEALVTSGDAAATLEQLTQLLKDQSSLDDATIEQESSAIAEHLAA